ncbi:chromatin associated protein KTI12 [Cyathus striatus]|nr:chromatin associated protein KTI12 [Cyathus striatus]
MALITVTGYPCSGKTSRAEQIKSYLDNRLQDPDYQGPVLTVSVLSDDSLGLNRSAYDDSRSEKPARGALFTAVQRQMSTNTILIVDGLNYIKGFRYQMYCAAREAKLRVCTVFVVASPELCRKWNQERKDMNDHAHAYAEDILENLFMRYEEPSSMVRWDSPLFTILSSDNNLPGPGIWEAVTRGNVKPPNAAVLSTAKAPVDALHTLEHASTNIVSAVMSEALVLQGVGGLVSIPLPNSSKIQLVLPARNITLSELQRLKRQFVTVHKKAITLGTTEKGSVDWDEESLGSKFAIYLEEHLKL